jgi:hypothetical protein
VHGIAGLGMGQGKAQGFARGQAGPTRPSAMRATVWLASSCQLSSVMALLPVVAGLTGHSSEGLHQLQQGLLAVLRL